MANDKTNAMRLLDKAGLAYRVHTYSVEGVVPDGVAVAGKIGMPVERVFKTLVTIGASQVHYVFVIPVSRELDLKASARSVDEKSVAMIKVADIEKATGYVRGGCSPLGMKKAYRTVFDMSANQLETIVVSAGKIGFQVEVIPADLIRLCGGMTASLSI